MNPKYQTKKFKELQAKWYKRLEKEGFEDAESDENHLKRWDSSIFRRYDQISTEFKAEYFRYAEKFLNDKEFDSKKEKLIWQYHTEGLSFVEISEKIRKRGYSKHSRSHMHVTVARLTKEMMNRYGIAVRQERPNRSEKLPA